MNSFASQRSAIPHVAADFNPRVLTVIEVSELLRCSKAHVHNLINGKVPGLRPLPSLSLGRRRLVRRETLDSWIAQNEQGAA